MNFTTFHEYVPHSDVEAKFAALDRTRDRLLSFAERKAGWDLGRGEPIRLGAIRDAFELLTVAFSKGVWRSNVFASPSGSVLLTFTMNGHDIEISVEGDGTFDFRHELHGEEVYEGQELDRPAVEKALEESAKKICMSEQSTQTTTTPTLVVSGARHSNLQVTGGYRYLVGSVQNAKVGQYASTSPAFTGMWPATHPFSGFYQTQQSPPELLCA